MFDISTVPVLHSFYFINVASCSSLRSSKSNTVVLTFGHYLKQKFTRIWILSSLCKA